MKHKKLNLFLVVCVSVCVFIGFVFKVTRLHGSKIGIEPEIFDLGKIDSLEPNIPERIIFKIKNLGTDMLNITEIQSGCSCIKIVLDKDLLLPGEVTQLSMSINLPLAIGEFRKKIIIRSNDPGVPIKELVVKGFIDRPCYVLPDSIIINNLNKGEKKEVELEINGPVGDRNFNVEKASAENIEIKTLKIEKIGTKTETSRVVWKIILSVESRNISKWEDKICILTSSKESPKLEVPVNVKELPVVKVNPAIAMFRYNNNETPTAQLQITMNTTNSKTVIIKDIKKPDWIDMQVEPDDKSLPAQLDLKLGIIPDMMKNDVHSNILIELGEELGKIEIPILIIPASNNNIIHEQSEMKKE